jgi:hypothetical protein
MKLMHGKQTNAIDGEAFAMNLCEQIALVAQFFC